MFLDNYRKNKIDPSCEEIISFRLNSFQVRTKLINNNNNSYNSNNKCKVSLTTESTQRRI